MPLAITFPPGTGLEILNGSNWATWSSCINALFRMNRLKNYIMSTADSADTDWDKNQEVLKGVLEMYI
jgi:hypothetical protein